MYGSLEQFQERFKRCLMRCEDKIRVSRAAALNVRGTHLIKSKGNVAECAALCHVCGVAGRAALVAVRQGHLQGTGVGRPMLSALR
jgi:hypothetical protein